MSPDPSRALAEAFARIARERMAALPMCHPALAVETVGFRRACVARDEAGWLGVLVTPWCMNLVWCPDDAARVAATGRTRTHRIGDEDYAFIGAHEAGVGAFEACSLFSPMSEFRDQAAARAVAQEVARLVHARCDAPPAQPARRRFLLRSAPGAAA